MAVNLQAFSQAQPLEGVRIAVVKSGMRYADRWDLVLFELAAGTHSAGVFTRNRFCAAPVRICQQHLSQISPRYLMINTGNANAGTGQQGLLDARQSCQWLAELAQTQIEEILPFSTGVIGEPLNMQAFQQGLVQALGGFSTNNWTLAAQGITTTDTLPKGYSKSVEVGGQQVGINGISKGAGMIKPNMATMLAFVATDAYISQPILDKWCRTLAEVSFNRISIDGDTSTNDSCILSATGCSQVRIEDEDSSQARALYAHLQDCFIALAQAIVRDGEGATKFVSVQVEQAKNTAEALQIAYTVAHSPLVKTALFASDANWGRILAAVGRAEIEQLDVDAVDIFLDEVQIVAKGGRAIEYQEEQGAGVFAKEEFCIRIVLARGSISETVWTTDLSHDYVKINAEYRS